MVTDADNELHYWEQTMLGPTWRSSLQGRFTSMGKSSSNSPEFSRFREVSSIPEVSEEQERGIIKVVDSFLEKWNVINLRPY